MSKLFLVPLTSDVLMGREREEKQFYHPLPIITKKGMHDLALKNGVVVHQIYGTGIVKSVSIPSSRNQGKAYVVMKSLSLL